MTSKGLAERSLTRRGFNHSPSWSPDGREIVFAHFLRLEGPSPAGLRIVTEDGRNLRVLTTNGGDGYPVWRPVLP
jgi:Tol biopolymer transport system component